MTQQKPEMNQEKWADEFDKWFNHGTKKEPHGLLASDYYKEIKQFIRQLLDKERRGELKFLRRLKLDFEVIHCECGEEWKNTDPHIAVKKRIKSLKETNDQS